LRVADTQNYVSEVATTLSEGQATTSVNTDSVDTGFTLTIGSSWDKSTVYANVDIELTDVQQIDNFAFSDSTDPEDPDDDATGTQTRIQLPQTSERQLSTQIRVRPGDSVLIGGLVRENDSFDERGPGIMEPILPDSRTALTENLELVVLLRPRVIVYTSAGDTKIPGLAPMKHSAAGVPAGINPPPGILPPGIPPAAPAAAPVAPAPEFKNINVRANEDRNAQLSPSAITAMPLAAPSTPSTHSAPAAPSLPPSTPILLFGGARIDGEIPGGDKTVPAVSPAMPLEPAKPIVSPVSSSSVSTPLPETSGTVMPGERFRRGGGFSSTDKIAVGGNAPVTGAPMSARASAAAAPVAIAPASPNQKAGRVYPEEDYTDQWSGPDSGSGTTSSTYNTYDVQSSSP
jgi:hypothetical protein